jgi:hypothetical protein
MESKVSDAAARSEHSFCFKTGRKQYQQKLEAHVGMQVDVSNVRKYYAISGGSARETVSATQRRFGIMMSFRKLADRQVHTTKTRGV